ncbi:MAG: hypothetical protein KF915_20280 [Polyangiaceae bacterium]|nr:hypothetical protein [Polyangiaceae bacterium]
MDRLRDDDLRRARATPPAVKLQHALEAMAAGIRLKRTSLRHEHPHTSDDEVEAMLRSWLQQDE